MLDLLIKPWFRAYTKYTLNKILITKKRKCSRSDIREYILFCIIYIKVVCLSSKRVTLTL